jgi:hypothetical protein
MTLVFLEALGWIPVDPTSKQMGHNGGRYTFLALGRYPVEPADKAVCVDRLPGWEVETAEINEGLGRIALVGALLFERVGGKVREVPLVQRDFFKVQAQVGDDSDIMSLLPRGTILAEVEYADQERFDNLVSKYETYN